MMEALAWTEQTAISIYVRENFYAYFVLLIFHAWGMTLLVGAGLALSLRMMGLASGSSLAKWRAVFTPMKLGAVLAILSGLGLLAGYPAKALTNWVFALKFACLIGAALLAARMGRYLVTTTAEPAGAVRLLAAASMALWIGAIAAGKLLLYTNVMLMTADSPW